MLVSLVLLNSFIASNIFILVYIFLPYLAVEVSSYIDIRQLRYHFLDIKINYKKLKYYARVKLFIKIKLF